MTEKEQLLPCPFCGGENVDICDMEAYVDLNHYCTWNDIKCTSLHVSIKSDTKQEAINKWNTRAISADEKEQLRRLKAFVESIFESSLGQRDGRALDFLIEHKLIKETDRWYELADWLKGENENL